MNRRDEIYCIYIIEHYEEILIKIEGLTFKMFCDNKTIQKSILFDVAQIGENINKLNELILDKLNRIDVKGIIGLRNHIIHGYGELNELTVWNAIKDELPNLIEQIKEVLEREKVS